MAPPEHDLATVRATVAGRVPNPAPSLARSRAIIAAGRRPAGPSRRHARWLVPVAASVIVLAIVVGATVLLRPGGDGDPPFPPGEVLGDLVPTPVPTEAVRAAMLAAAAGAEPVVPAEGQLIYARFEGEERWAPGEPGVPQIVEEWREPAGMIVVGYRFYDDPLDPPEWEVVDTEPERQVLATEGPSFAYPTAEWLAGLPTDPEALRPRLEERGGQIAGGEPGAPPTADWWIFDAAGELLERTEPVLPVALRIALYQVLLDLPEVATAEVSYQGRQLFVLRHRVAAGLHEDGVQVDLYLDPGTGRVVGGGSLDEAELPRSQWGLGSYAVVDEIGATS